MWKKSVLAILVLGILHITSAQIWSCTEDADCSHISGGVCQSGACVCPFGQQPVLGGTLCADFAPYHTSTCFEDHQCSRMSFLFACHRANETYAEGTCSCQQGHHYFLGRCWPTADFGESCTRHEECLSVLRNPYSLTCDGTCRCAEGFYERQRGECREIGRAVGDGCVIDTDCQFDGGVCDVSTFSCYNENEDPPNDKTQSISLKSEQDISKMAAEYKMASRQHGVACSALDPCEDPFECSSTGLCWCPIGYYPSSNGSSCYAELGSPATAEQCGGLLAVVRDGVCSCPPNFFFDHNMRDCVRVTRRITESCVTDSNCHTFGAAARCGPRQDPWGLRSCECDLEYSVWDSNRQMCRLFAGVGEQCEIDSDCLAGELEIQCREGDDGLRYCTCPEGFTAVDGLCLTFGLELGDACQVSAECTGTANTVCEDGRCSCDSTSFQEVDGVCAAIIGGACSEDSDCVVNNTVCTTANGTSTCQCRAEFIQSESECWPVLTELETNCSVSAQCHGILGVNSVCSAGSCHCAAGHHFRDGSCWRVTGLFESCSRTSQCFLQGHSERVVCRNSLCQCEFHYPYSEELNTCRSSSSTITASVFLLLCAIVNSLT